MHECFYKGSIEDFDLRCPHRAKSKPEMFRSFGDLCSGPSGSFSDISNHLKHKAGTFSHARKQRALEKEARCCDRWQAV